MAEEGDCFTSPGRCQSPVSDRKRLGLGGEAAGAGSPLCPGQDPRGARRGPRGRRSPLPGVLSRHARLSPPGRLAPWSLPLRAAHGHAGARPGPRRTPQRMAWCAPGHRRLARPGPGTPSGRLLGALRVRPRLRLRQGSVAGFIADPSGRAQPPSPGRSPRPHWHLRGFQATAPGPHRPSLLQTGRLLLTHDRFNGDEKVSSVTRILRFRALPSRREPRSPGSAPRAPGTRGPPAALPPGSPPPARRAGLPSLGTLPFPDVAAKPTTETVQDHDGAGGGGRAGAETPERHPAHPPTPRRGAQRCPGRFSPGTQRECRPSALAAPFALTHGGEGWNVLDQQVARRGCTPMLPTRLLHLPGAWPGEASPVGPSGVGQGPSGRAYAAVQELSLV